MNAKLERRQYEWRRDVSHPDIWYGGLTGDGITPDRGRCGQGACGVRARDPLDSQLADRLEETYRQSLPRRGLDKLRLKRLADVFSQL